jgi:hypothetical protein
MAGGISLRHYAGYIAWLTCVAGSRDEPTAARRRPRRPLFPHHTELEQKLEQQVRQPMEPLTTTSTLPQYNKTAQ